MFRNPESWITAIRDLLSRRLMTGLDFKSISMLTRKSIWKEWLKCIISNHLIPKSARFIFGGRFYWYLLLSLIWRLKFCPYCILPDSCNQNTFPQITPSSLENQHLLLHNMEKCTLAILSNLLVQSIVEMTLIMCHFLWFSCMTKFIWTYKVYWPAP